MIAKGVIPWEESFPSGIGHTSIDFIRNHGNRELFIKAKSGDEVAAVALVRKCIKPDKVKRMREKYSDCILVPVLAKERTGYNVIPLAYAKILSSYTGLQVNDDIFQINDAHHTGACAMQRLLRRPEFDGTIARGYNCIILDDVVTQGGTASALRRFIKDNGSNVAAVSALAFGKDSSTIALQPEIYKGILDKFGRDSLEGFLHEKGIVGTIEELTNAEGKYLLKFKDIDAIRNRAYEVSVQRVLKENRRVFEEKSRVMDKAI